MPVIGNPVNQLVAGLTLGIYTPMYIEVTCADPNRRVDAEGSANLEVDPEATAEEKREALTEAASLSAQLGSAVFVSF